MTVGDCFAGIGGFSLGFERAGFEIAWQIEIDPYCNKVLEKHWPDVQRFGDIREVADPPRVDVVCGGFPCQDISNAGPGAGIRGGKSGLWWEMLRLIRMARPRYVAVENVSAITHNGLDVVLGSLAELGYDAEWETLSACMFGAPHMRRRMFIVAHSCGDKQLQPEGGIPNERRRPSDSRTAPRATQWITEPDVARLADGIPHRAQRERANGNAIVPQVAEYVANCIMDHANRTSS